MLVGAGVRAFMTEITERDRYWMQYAIDAAGQAAILGEVPVGALIVRDQEVLAVAHNQPIKTSDPTAHAEIVALREACRRTNNYRLPGATLYVTIEPCSMCAAALVHARVARLVFGAPEPKAGAIVSAQQLLDAPFLNHRVAYHGGCEAEACRTLMQTFFQRRRQQHRS